MAAIKRNLAPGENRNHIFQPAANHYTDSTVYDYNVVHYYMPYFHEICYSLLQLVKQDPKHVVECLILFKNNFLKDIICIWSVFKIGRP